MTGSCRKVAVDLTPVLPGGENGGAKTFALELVGRLGKVRPHAELVLLTSPVSHDEVEALETPQTRRHLLSSTTQGPEGTGGQELASRVRDTLERDVAPSMPGWIRTTLRGPYERITYRWSRVLPKVGVDLYFCPFTAPANAHPKIPTVCVVHDVQYRDYPTLFTKLDWRERDIHLRLACRRAKRLICPSSFVRRTIEATQLALTGQVAEIPHATQARLPLVDRGTAEEALSSRGLTPRGYLLYPANFWKHKNHEMLLAAFSLFLRRGERPLMKLVCTGESGARRDDLKRLAGAMGLAEAVVFPGFVAVEEFAALMRGARALVFPSLYEGFGMPVLEAMREGVPVACSDRTSLPEVAGGAALLFDPRKPEDVAEAISRLAKDDALLGELSEKGRARVERLPGADEMAERYWRVFDEVCA
jgi:glycosyltransferase involved in cell wall biosynthesis